MGGEFVHPVVGPSVQQLGFHEQHVVEAVDGVFKSGVEFRSRYESVVCPLEFGISDQGMCGSGGDQSTHWVGTISQQEVAGWDVIFDAAYELFSVEICTAPRKEQGDGCILG